jgi:glutaconate CoA-transferase, subunit B
MTNRDYTLNEMLVCSLARELNNGEVGFTGLATGGAAALFATAIPLAAMELARRTHAPDLSILLAGWISNPDLNALEALPTAEFAEELRDLPAEAHNTDYPGFWPHRSGGISFGFGSGAQVDQQGNVNSVLIGDPARPKVRLVGSILLPEHFSVFGREYSMMPRHDTRSFVAKVDYVAGVGYPGGAEGRAALGLPGGGPEMVMTPMCLFDFDKQAGRMKVRSIHPGVTAEDVQRATGFDLGDLSDVPDTAPPMSEELDIIRREIDPRSVLLSYRVDE